MADAQLVHLVQRLPVFRVQIEKVHLAVSVRVLAADEQDFVIRDG